MVAITGLYEVAIKVRDLKTAERFYREVLGLQFSLLDERRNWPFLRAGAATLMAAPCAPSLIGSCVS